MNTLITNTTLIHSMCTALSFTTMHWACHSQSAPLVTQTTEIYAEASLGDVVDKILVLKIKQERIQDPAKLANINKELQLLTEAYQASTKPSEKLDELSIRLLQVNKNLWELEDSARLKEHEKCFDQEFVAIVDSILNNNDERACIKRTINLLGNSRIIEEKSYTDIIATDIDNCSESELAQPVAIMIKLPLGDLADRITILIIKKDRITDPAKHANIIAEYQILNETLKKSVDSSAEFDSLLQDLMQANSSMWDIQNQLRAKKQANQFDNEFINLGRSAYYTNDKRCAIKRQINNLYGSQLVEEKCYTNY